MFFAIVRCNPPQRIFNSVAKQLARLDTRLSELDGSGKQPAESEREHG